MKINPGDLTALVQFRRAVLVDDGLSRNEQFSDHGTVTRARKRDMSDSERLRAGELVAQGTSRFVLRRSPFSSDLTPKDRLVCAGLEYSILHIKALDDGRRWIEVTASARIDG